jgi:hypothetical protein
MSEVNMVQPDETITEPMEPDEDEEWEDYLDCCAAAEAIDEALRTREITPLEDFIRELGLEKECRS